MTRSQWKMYGLKNIKTAVSPTSLPPLSIYAEKFVLLFSLVNPIHLLPRVCLLSSFVGSVNKNSDSHFTSIRSFLMSQLLASGHQSIWSFSFSISPSNEYSGLISFRIDWSDLLAIQGTLKSLLQHHNSKAWIPQCSAFFMVQVSPWLLERP